MSAFILYFHRCLVNVVVRTLVEPQGARYQINGSPVQIQARLGHFRLTVPGYRPQLLQLGSFHEPEACVLLLISLFPRAIHGLIFRVLWLDSIVGGSNLSRYTAWQGWLGGIAKI